jgi:hypothetical protein
MNQDAIDDSGKPFEPETPEAFFQRGEEAFRIWWGGLDPPGTRDGPELDYDTARTVWSAAYEYNVNCIVLIYDGAEANADGAHPTGEMQLACVVDRCHNGSISLPRRDFVNWVAEHEDHIRREYSADEQDADADMLTVWIDHAGESPSSSGPTNRIPPTSAESLRAGADNEFAKWWKRLNPPGTLLSPGIRWKAVADRAEIINDTISSDPNIDVPLPCLIQYPSRNYHSSADRLQTLSPEVMERIGLVSATQLYSLAASDAKAARWLAQVVVGANRDKWHRAQLRLLSGSWPFDLARTREWFGEQAELSVASIERFGLSGSDVSSVQAELQRAVADWCQQYQAAFPPAAPRNAPASLQRQACSLVLERTTRGSPKAWGLRHDSPEDERADRELLYRHNLDLLFHRIFYWADGQRSLMDIIQRLEFEMDELRRDTSISRTSSGLAIADKASPELDLDAVLTLVDRIVANGYFHVPLFGRSLHFRAKRSVTGSDGG